jgi:hypothetical protein
MQMWDGSKTDRRNIGCKGVDWIKLIETGSSDGHCNHGNEPRLPNTKEFNEQLINCQVVMTTIPHAVNYELQRVPPSISTDDEAVFSSETPECT